MGAIRIPNSVLYPHQKRVFNKIVREGKKYLALCWHRRCGKDILAMNIITYLAFNYTGTFLYIFPMKNQVRTAIFEGIMFNGRRILDIIPEGLITRVDKINMKIYLRNKHGEESIIVFTGSDHDGLVGGSYKGIVFSEYAICNPNIWYYLEPSVRRNDGFAIMISTPRGYNHFHELIQQFKANDRAYVEESMTIEESMDFAGNRIFTEQDFKDVLANGTPYETALQEYYCSYDIASSGAFYKEQMEWLRTNDRFGDYKISKKHQVYISVDLGGANASNDETVLWFAQYIDGKIRIIHCYANTGQILPHYVDYAKQYLTSRGVRNKPVWLMPHDIKKTDLWSGRTNLQRLGDMGVQVEAIPKTSNVFDDINYVREHMNMCEFDSNECWYGIEMLKRYSKKFNKSLGQYDESKVDHNEASHYADSFRYLLIGLKILKNRTSQRTFKY